MSTAAPLQQTKAESNERRKKSASQPMTQLAADFVDFRSQAATQRQLQKIADNSAQARQLKTCSDMLQNSPRAMQTMKKTTDSVGEGLQDNFRATQRVGKDAFLPAPSSIEDSVQLIEHTATKPNNTGLPNQLKAGIESLSGMSMDHVKVNYDSDKPSQLNAHAYAQGSEIHVAPGQEQHLPHEAWHVVQQAQGRVRPTTQLKEGVPINDDASLEAEADLMGARALSNAQLMPSKKQACPISVSDTKQLMLSKDPKAGANIKIWAGDDGVLEVTFVKHSKGKVFYQPLITGKMPKKSPKPTVIDEKFAFDLMMGNAEIKRRVETDAKEEIEVSDIKSTVPETVLNFLMEKVALFADANDVEKPEMTPTRMLLAMGSSDILKVYLDQDWTDEEGGEKWFIENYAEYFDDETLGLYQSMNAATNSVLRSDTATSSDTSSTTKKAKWMHESIKKQKAVLIGNAGPNKLLSSGTSLHHKLSRSRIKRMLRLFQSASSPAMSSALHAITRETGITDPKKALENWAPNLELGPIVNARAEGTDPGAGFDGNVTDGSLTPRSKELAGIDIALLNAESAVDWDALAAALGRIQTAHGTGNQITPPKLGQWHQTDGGIVRDREPNEGKEEAKQEFEDELSDDSD
ncbi:DUF4157 domain-containing protein [Solimicrobium silvestre]|uniref:eCIS core domain-containing protein n=1 Tax=Solimicrobium silvestre TaxID=2099400 RepID=A0A2S9GUH9_9BURK|nr:DUF4157 domain-containing protein [Solimicrobium silvestre]PRC91361.1 hypothetical protein S2091_3906 [Solimicrobium silvestre]